MVGEFLGMARTGFVFSQAGYGHETPPGHPECSDRLRVVEQAFTAAKLDPQRIGAREATRDELLRVHSSNHIDLIAATCAQRGDYPDPDTFMSPGSWKAALEAAGGAIEACRNVLEGGFDNAFCAMRPPGHHAEHDRAMGFCLFNSVAVAAQWLREEGGLDRVAILDWDVHHGNGTQYSFYDNPNVFYASIHQCPHYPGTGRAEERGAGGANLNLPMAPDTPREVWLAAIREEAIPVLEDFDAQFLLVSSGFDAHVRDPLSSQNLETEDYAEMTRMVSHLAEGKIVSLLEGGYGLDALGVSAVAHYEALRET